MNALYIWGPPLWLLLTSDVRKCQSALSADVLSTRVPQTPTACTLDGSGQWRYQREKVEQRLEQTKPCE